MHSNGALNGIRDGQRGVASVVVAIGLMTLAGFAALAVDYGYLHMKRSQLQTAADAASLAGATAMMSFRGNLAAVRTTALGYARRNLGADDRPDLAARTTDVSFYRDGTPNTTSPNQIEVTLGLTRDRGNPVRLFLAAAMGITQADLQVTARAGLYAVGSSRCLKPFTVPTKFSWNDSCDPSNSYRNNGQLDLASSCEKASVKIIGYGPSDVGTQVTLKVGNPHEAIVPSWYNPIDYPPVNRGNPVSGGSIYRDNIAGCTGSNNTIVAKNDELAMEPGNMAGPTKQGLDELLAQDPGARWDSSTKAITGSQYPDPLNSPRVALIAFYDPLQPPTSGRNSIFVYQLGSVFIEGVNGGGDVTARFIESVAVSPESSDPNGMLYSVRLVRDSSRGR